MKPRSIISAPLPGLFSCASAALFIALLAHTPRASAVPPLSPPTMEGKTYVEIEGAGSGCLKKAQAHSDEPSAQRKFLAQCSREYRHKVETSDEPEFKRKREDRNRLLTCAGDNRALRTVEEYAAWNHAFGRCVKLEDERKRKEKQEGKRGRD